MQGRWREINKLKNYIRCEIFRIYFRLDIGKDGEGFLRVTPRLAEITENIMGPIRKIRCYEQSLSLDCGGGKIKSSIW